jgi:hypothetical protein
MARSWLLVVPALAMMVFTAAGCSSGGEPEGTGTTAAPPPAANDGITLTSTSPTRVTGTYVNGATTIDFDLAKVGDDLFANVTGNSGRPIVRIQTSGDAYEFSYMGGGLTLNTTKTYVAQQRVQAQADPNNVSTSQFAFVGDMHVLDQMLQLPEVSEFPRLSRALGARGITGSDYPASLVLHKMGQQAAGALGINVASLDLPGVNGYCASYPNAGDSCYGMCGPGCSCWSWVCGDCCYHYGCAVHDSWCRAGEWWWCYDITAVIALFGC